MQRKIKDLLAVSPLEIEGMSGNPGTLRNGMLWYDSTAGALKARINGSTVNLGAGGGGGDALTSNPLSQFASTTSAQLAGTISDASGTGALLFANGDIGDATGTSLTTINDITATQGGLVTGDVTHGGYVTIYSYVTLGSSATIQFGGASSRVWEIPDNDDTFVGEGTTQTLSNKTLNNSSVSGTIDGTPSGGTLDLSSLTVTLPNAPLGQGKAGFSWKYKNADTSRTTTTTVADDPDLTISLSAGTYIIRVSLCFSNASTSPGEKFKVAFSGTYSIATGTLEIGNHVAAGIRGSYPNSTDADVFAPTFSDANRNEWGFVNVFLKATGTGTFSLQWAQSTSHADATTLKKGSFMQIQRIE